MSDVVITLSLARKSGILAAAVSTLNRAGLQFNSHHFIPVESGHKICLRAESEEPFGDPRGVIDDLSRIRGVDAVIDVEVDDRSLLNAEPEFELESDPESEVQTGLDSVWSLDSGDEAVLATERSPEPEPEPGRAREPNAPLEDKASALDTNARMRPSMVRRRRRRR